MSMSQCLLLGVNGRAPRPSDMSAKCQWATLANLDKRTDWLAAVSSKCRVEALEIDIFLRQSPFEGDTISFTLQLRLVAAIWL
jgi:hypothetical protein